MKKHNLTLAIALTFLSATKTFGSGMGDDSLLDAVQSSYAGIASHSDAYNAHSRNIGNIDSIATEAGLMAMLDAFVSPMGNYTYGILNTSALAATCKEKLVAKGNTLGINSANFSKIYAAFEPKLTPMEEEASAVVSDAVASEAPTSGGSSGGDDMDVATTSSSSVAPLPEPVAVDVSALMVELEVSKQAASCFLIEKEQLEGFLRDAHALIVEKEAEKERHYQMAKVAEQRAVGMEADAVAALEREAEALATNDALRAQLAALRAELDAAQSSSSSSSSELSSLAASNADKDAEIAELRAQVQTERAAAVKTQAVLQLAFENLEVEFARVNAEKNSEIAILVAKLSASDATSSDQLKQITQSAARIEQLEAEKTALQSALEATQAEANTQRQAIAAREARIAQAMALLAPTAPTFSGGSFGGFSSN